MFKYIVKGFFIFIITAITTLAIMFLIYGNQHPALELRKKNYQISISKDKYTSVTRKNKKIASLKKAEKIINSSSSLPELEGKVLLVNQAYNFIVIDLGKSDNLKTNDPLYVYDGSDLMAEVFVEITRENVLAASGSDDLDVYRIKPGNKVYSDKKIKF
jgi:hypothetical protein